jgi:hypothetical protein
MPQRISHIILEAQIVDVYNIQCTIVYKRIKDANKYESKYLKYPETHIDRYIDIPMHITFYLRSHSNYLIILILFSSVVCTNSSKLIQKENR